MFRVMRIQTEFRFFEKKNKNFKMNCFSTSSLLLAKLVEKNVRLAYFSGSGNTLLTVERLKQRLEKDFDKKVELFPIDKTKPEVFLGNPSQISETVYGIATPITWGGCFPIVEDFCAKLNVSKAIQDKKKPKLISIATMGSFHGGYV